MRRRILTIGVLCVMPLLSSGCAALVVGAAAGGGTTFWLQGKLVQEVDAPLDKSVQAVKSTLESLGLDVIKETMTDVITQITSTYTDGKKIWIDVHKVSDSTSRIEVRVGMISNKDAARTILNRIVTYLRRT